MECPCQECGECKFGIGNLRVGASVGHGQESGPGVLDLEVLVGKLLAVDGLATSALQQKTGLSIDGGITYVATGEVTTLEHEVWDDTVEAGALVASNVGLANAEAPEVVGSLGDYVIVQLEDDALGLGA
ncbi:hypothetical protein PpBr36_00063 [Pyricularia pennisetigena]|uniref:hypothetical protein n=1 Tax=Pyricularia pennisetigena TaxID=1578925 RepID=UPI00114FC96A|nr:hypothetical protein PpBr36_00063 [Pyricularia pennisetigena]TLS29117.1 hypothetical protein PpBr36_00063 [Pyricularia pennisetigena]